MREKIAAERLWKIILAVFFFQAQLNFKEQVDIREFEDLCQAFGDDIKKFDFVVCGKDKTYFIEANFYTISGSKLNEVARSYQDLALKFEAFPNYEFIWITDGIGWLDALQICGDLQFEQCG